MGTLEDNLVTPVDSVDSSQGGDMQGGSLATLADASPSTPALQGDSSPQAPSQADATQGAPSQDSSLASAIPSMQPDDMPRFQRTVGSTLKGMLWGLATGGVKGAAAGAVDPTRAQKHFQQNEDVRQAGTDQAVANAQNAQNNVQFESVRAADSHILALKNATRIDQLDAESRAQIRDLGDKHAQFLNDQFGIIPDLSLEGNGQEVDDQANGGIQTLAAQNAGQIPPIASIVHPHTDDNPKFKVSVYAPTQQSLQQNMQGYRKLVDSDRAMKGLPPIDDLTWNSGGGQGFKGVRQMVTDAIQDTSPVEPFSEQTLPAQLAQRKQQLAAYQNHVGVDGKPDADPAMAAVWSKKVDFLQNALTDVNKTKNDQAASETAARAKAELPYALAKTKAEEAVHDGDPAAAGQLLVSGDVAPSQLVSSRKPAFAQQAFTEARKLDPNWNAQAAEGYYKTAGAPQNVQFFGSAKSLTDQGGTLDQLQSQYNKIPNGKLPSFNKAADFIEAAAGSGPIAGFAQTAVGVADDYAKVMGGGQGSDTSRNQVLQGFAASKSPAQMKASIAAARAAVYSQMQSRVGSNPVMRKMYGDQLPPTGATMRVPGSDGKLHWSDGKRDLGTIG